MINLSPKLYFICCPAPIPLRIEGYQKKGGEWNKAGPCGAFLIQKPLSVSCFLFVERFSLPDLPKVPKTRLKHIMIRIVTGLLVPPEGI